MQCLHAVKIFPCGNGVPVCAYEIILAYKALFQGVQRFVKSKSHVRSIHPFFGERNFHDMRVSAVGILDVGKVERAARGKRECGDDDKNYA